MAKTVGFGGVFHNTQDPKREVHAYGRFARIWGPEGSRLEL